jgi:flagellar hook-associated protein 3 FlgL
MPRVSDNSTTIALTRAINKSKEKLENLQMKGTSLKSFIKPSDNPTSNVEVLEIKSRTADNKQFLKNSGFATLYLSATEKSIEQLTDILVKAKDLALQQSSDFYDKGIRQNISNEVEQLNNQSLAIANKRIGNRYIFSGFDTLTQPFAKDGKYAGDKGHINLEVAKDFFVPINLNGEEVFFSDYGSSSGQQHPLEFKDELGKPAKLEKINRSFASGQRVQTDKEDKAKVGEGEQFDRRDNIFSMLGSFKSALENNDPKLIQSLLVKFDNGINRLITMRTRVGSIMNSINTTEDSIHQEQVDHMARKSELIDADIGEVFSELQKQEQVLKTTYQAGQMSLNSKLLDFIR